MDSYRTPRKILRVFQCNSLVIAAVAIALALLTASTPTYAVEAPSAADRSCLGCHGSAGMEKKLADGEVLRLQVGNLLRLLDDRRRPAR